MRGAVDVAIAKLEAGRRALVGAIELAKQVDDRYRGFLDVTAAGA